MKIGFFLILLVVCYMTTISAYPKHRSTSANPVSTAPTSAEAMDVSTTTPTRYPTSLYIGAFLCALTFLSVISILAVHCYEGRRFYFSGYRMM